MRFFPVGFVSLRTSSVENAKKLEKSEMPQPEMASNFIFPLATAAIPQAADTEMARRGFEQWAETVAATLDREELSDHTSDPTKNPIAHRLMSAIFGNSPFLTFCIMKEPELFMLMLRSGPDRAYAHVSETLTDKRKQNLNDADLSRLLRVCKRQVALITAAADICGAWRCLLRRRDSCP